MRITNSMMNSQFLSDANASLNRVSQYESQLDSTKKITRISDDPQATIMALQARNRLSDLSLYQGNISTANSYLSETESAASEMNDILQSAYEQAVSANTGTKSQDELDTIADEIKNLKNEVLSVGNASIGTSNIFGGYNYTGSTDGVNKTAPFSTNSVTGDLIYNGIDLSQFAWKAEFDSNTSLMSNFSSSILGLSSDLNASLTDANSLTICNNVVTAATGLQKNGEAALRAAEKFGVDTGSDEYKALSDFLSNFSSITGNLEKECSKQCSGDYVLESDPSIRLTDGGEIDYNYYKENNTSVMTDEEFANCYSSGNCKTILAEMTSLLQQQVDASGNPTGSDMDKAVQQLSGAISIPADVQGALTAETAKQTKLQVGTSQTVDLAFTGLDILGEGKDNIYHILDKFEDILRENTDTEGINQMITSLQNKQSDVLDFEAKIGSTQNRLDLISSRYDTSELNYKEMKSEAEDADMAEAATNFTTAKTVYNAALAAGAELIQTSLIDFLK